MSSSPSRVGSRRAAARARQAPSESLGEPADAAGLAWRRLASGRGDGSGKELTRMRDSD